MKSHELNRVMRRQDGLITLEQAASVGADAKTACTKVASGIWEQRYRTVYAATAAPVTDLQRVRAAWLAAGEGAVVSHATAAWLWDLDGGHLDFYLFAAPSFATIAERYTRLTGRPALLPRWVFGFHQGGASNDQSEAWADGIAWRKNKGISSREVVRSTVARAGSR